MSDFKKRFDELMPAALSALHAKRDDFSAAFYGVDIAYVRRLIERVSINLKKIDDKQINHPTYLAGVGQTTPEKSIQLISIMPSTITENGVAHFINTTLADFVQVDDSLSRAIGLNEIRSADIKSSQLKAIEKHVDWTRQAHATVNRLRSETQTASKDASEASAKAKNLTDVAEADAKKIKELRAAAVRLSKGTKTSPALLTILRDSQEKLSEIESARSKADSAYEEIVKIQGIIEEQQSMAETAVAGLTEQDNKARGILNNATQAGLAGAFKIERETLAKQQSRYAWTFYGIIVLVILYAAIFIVPIASNIITENSNDAQGKSIGESALLLFVRILIALPAFWALIFTNRRFVYLETLQMDYAAKAVTALAYSGYRDEMGDDTALSSRLRGGLVERFIEHPSRLLNGYNEGEVPFPTGELPPTTKRSLSGQSAEGAEPDSPVTEE